jgi:hypothetical protein
MTKLFYQSLLEVLTFFSNCISFFSLPSHHHNETVGWNMGSIDDRFDVTLKLVELCLSASPSSTSFVETTASPVTRILGETKLMTHCIV